MTAQPAHSIVIPYTPRPWQLQVHAGLRSRRFGCVVAHRRAGKTVCLVNHLLLAALEAPPRPGAPARFSYVAPYLGQAKQLAWEYLKHYSACVPGRKVNESELWVSFAHNGARVRIHGCDNPDSLRGSYFDGIVLDEFADMHPDAWETVILPALADRQGWACLSGTPRGHNAFFTVWREALHSPLWFAGLYRAEGEQATGALSDADLAQLKAGMHEARYRQEFLCDFDVSSSDALIPLPLALEAAGRPGLTENHQPLILGVDVARFGDDASVIFARRGRDARILPYERCHGLDVMQLAGRVMDFARRHHAHTVFVDGGGVGGGLVDRLHQLGLDAVEVNFGGKSGNPACLNKRAEMWLALAEWLKIGAIPDDAALLTDLTGVTYGFDAANKLHLESKESMKKRGLASPDLGDALALTFAWPVRPLSLAEEFAASINAAPYDPLTHGSSYDPFA